MYPTREVLLLTNAPLDTLKYFLHVHNVSYKYIEDRKETNPFLIFLQEVQLKPDDLIELSKKYYSIPTTSKETSASCFIKIVEQEITTLTPHQITVACCCLNEILPILYNKLHTLNQTYSNIRTILKNKYGLDSLEYKNSFNMDITDEDKASIKDEYTQQLKTKNRNPIEFSKELVLNVINEEKGTALSLMLASGTRPIELFSKNIFTVCDNNIIMIHNLAKKRGSKKEDYVKRPLIGYDAKEFINYVNELRNTCPEPLTASKKLKNKYSYMIRKQMNKYFPACSPKLCRKIYGNLAYDLFAEADGNLNIYLSDILGHGKNDLSTSFAYSSVKLI